MQVITHMVFQMDQKRLESFKYLRSILNTEYKENNKLKIIDLEEKLLIENLIQDLGMIFIILVIIICLKEKKFFSVVLIFRWKCLLEKLVRKGFTYRITNGIIVLYFLCINQYMQWNKWLEIFNTTVKFLCT